MPILPHIFKKNQKKKAQSKQDVDEEKKDEIKNKEENKDKKDKDKKNKDKKKGSSAAKVESAHAAHEVLVRPHISEKSVSKNDVGKYVFEVYPSAGKKEIAQAVEETYGVKVKKVNKIKTHRKNKRYRFQEGTSARHDKAVVTLKEGQGIEVLPH